MPRWIRGKCEVYPNNQIGERLGVLLRTPLGL